ncbi:IMS domain-containing protein [Amnibacterium setariae]|nr:IMS domain-containing protein [Amnibacterium setariae]
MATATSVEPLSAVTPPAAAARRRIDDHSAAAIVSTYSRSVSALTARSSADELAQVVTGEALQEVQAQVLELKANGWSVRGAPRIAELRVLRSHLDSTVPTATVEACVDSRDVRTVDSAGKTVLANPHASRRALNLYDLAYRDGAWRVDAHGFPSDTRC